jgi:hypothetical protein
MWNIYRNDAADTVKIIVTITPPSSGVFLAWRNSWKPLAVFF